MPASNRRASQAAERSEAVSLLSLPDDLLIHCLNHLSQQERFQHASMVCKRFRALCLAPQLLRSIEFYPLDSATAMLQRLRALPAFLAASGRHLERLTIEIVQFLDFPDTTYVEIDAAAQLVHTSLEACSGVCSRMQQLHVEFVGSLSTESWLAGLTALQQLRLTADCSSLFLSTGISGLYSLVEAELHGSHLEWGTAKSLPPSLSRLRWSGDQSKQLPPQLSQLSHLTSLEISESNYSADGMALLTTLTTLRTLRLEHSCNVLFPPCLSALTWLEQLAIQKATVTAVEHALELQLSNLQNLTCLSICGGDFQCILPALAGLSRLQRLCLYAYPSDDADFSLPQGPWLASIRWLGLPWGALQWAAGTLRNAPCLEYLCGFHSGDPPEGHPLWALAASHPPLCCLGFEILEEGGRDIFMENPSNASALAALRLSRPQLHLRFLWHFKQFEAELLECDTIPEDDGYF